MSVVSAFISIAKYGVSTVFDFFFLSLIDCILIVCHLLNVPKVANLSEFISPEGGGSVKIEHRVLFPISKINLLVAHCVSLTTNMISDQNTVCSIFNF